MGHFISVFVEVTLPCTWVFGATLSRVDFLHETSIERSFLASHVWLHGAKVIAHMYLYIYIMHIYMYIYICRYFMYYWGIWWSCANYLGARLYHIAFTLVPYNCGLICMGSYLQGKHTCTTHSDDLGMNSRYMSTTVKTEIDGDVP